MSLATTKPCPPVLDGNNDSVTATYGSSILGQGEDTITLGNGNNDAVSAHEVGGEVGGELITVGNGNNDTVSINGVSCTTISGTATMTRQPLVATASAYGSPSATAKMAR